MGEPLLEPGLRERQKQELRALIYETALELFRTQGFEATSVQTIVVAAGIAKGTFFNYFPSKDHVLQEWYRRVTRDSLAEVDARDFACGQDTILALIDALISGVTPDPELWDAKAGATSSLILRAEEDALDKEVFDFCKRAIERDTKSGLFSQETDAEFLTGLILSVLTGTSHSWTVSGHGFDLSEQLRARLTFLFNAAHS